MVIVYSQGGKACFSIAAENEVFSGVSLQKLGARMRTYVWLDMICNLLVVIGIGIICYTRDDGVQNYFKSVE